MSTEALITVALLGCSRSPKMPAPPDSRLDATWRSLSACGPEEVLQALALSGVMLKAGVIAGEDLEGEETRVLEGLPDLSPAAVESLLRLLEGEWEEFLPECLDLASLTGSVVPGRAIPELLKIATRKRDLRPVVTKLAGLRARRLAQKHAEFSWLLMHGEISADAWDSDFRDERLAWFAHMRLEDPDRALQSVVEQWSGEEGAFRESLMRIIASSPIRNDEAWLESVGLKDRRQEVREQAMVALGQLEGSRFRERAFVRAKSVLKIERRLFKKVLTLAVPEAYEVPWGDDGVREKPPQGTGEKAWWIRQIIGLIPLGDWPALLGCKEDELLTLPLDPDWADPIVSGWIDSALRWPDRAMPARLIPRLLEVKPWPSVGSRQALIARLLETMDLQSRYQMLDRLGVQLETPEFISLLVSNPTPPPPGGGAATLAILDRLLTGKDVPLDRHQARLLARCVPRPEIRARLEAISRLQDLTPATEEFARALEFRQSLFTQFAPSST